MLWSIVSTLCRLDEVGLRRLRRATQKQHVGILHN